MSVETVLAGLRPDIRHNWADIVHSFAMADDVELADIIERLPVSDIMAVDPAYIRSEYFEHFSKVMRLHLTYERLIRKSLAACVPVLKNLQKWDKSEFPGKTKRELRWNLRLAVTYSTKLSEAKDSMSLAVPECPAPESKITEAIRYDASNSQVDIVLQDYYPRCAQLLSGRKVQLEAVRLALAEIKAAITRSQIRFNALRRREFRKAIVANHHATFVDFVKNHGSSWQLHETKLDRIVIDIYHPDLFTYNEVVRSQVNLHESHIADELDKGRIPTEAYIDAIKALSAEEGLDIDSLVEGFQKQRSDALRDGFVSSGSIVKDLDIGKVIFTYRPYKSGAPVRLRIIANVQNLIRRQLFEESPELEDIYKAHTWSSGSELNFIMPEDYDYYVLHEASVCNWLEYTGKELFRDMVEEYLQVGLSSQVDMIIYVSQWEVCYEVPFQPQKVSIPMLKRFYKSPSLVDYLFGRFSQYQQYANAYANFKIEKETNRPSFYLDISSLDPTLPVMQYKVYPKFRNLHNHIMIRHEITPTKFTKFVGGAGPDSLSLSELVLSSPAYCRESIERYLQFELFHNGVSGQGYNRRFRELPEDAFESHWMAVVKAAVFGSKAGLFTSKFQALMDTGKLPVGIPRTYREKMLSLGILSKKKRGLYVLSENFSRAVLRLRSDAQE